MNLNAEICDLIAHKRLTAIALRQALEKATAEDIDTFRREAGQTTINILRRAVDDIGFDPGFLPEEKGQLTLALVGEKMTEARQTFAEKLRNLFGVPQIDNGANLDPFAQALDHQEP